ncbi:MAG: PqqD family protein [Candidatus Omnitrophota bacterium]
MAKAGVLRKNPDMVTRVIDDETILMPIYKTSDEINCIYTLNKVASEVWKLIDGKKSLAAIKKIVLEKFDTTEEEAEKEMKKFLKDLKEIKAIK